MKKIYIYKYNLKKKKTECSINYSTDTKRLYTETHPLHENPTKRKNSNRKSLTNTTHNRTNRNTNSPTQRIRTPKYQINLSKFSNINIYNKDCNGRLVGLMYM